MMPEEQAGLAAAVLEAVRNLSRQGRLAAQEDVLAALAADAAPDEERNALIAGILASHPDIARFTGLSGRTMHHAPELMSRTYARILDRKGTPLLLLAEEIRANSRDYPRPVPVELFEGPPFDLSPEEIAETLRALAASPEHQDITFTVTQSGAVHLFSTRHLERGYAAFLAEQAETLAMNP